MYQYFLEMPLAGMRWYKGHPRLQARSHQGMVCWELWYFVHLLGGLGQLLVASVPRAGVRLSQAPRGSSCTGVMLDMRGCFGIGGV